MTETTEIEERVTDLEQDVAGLRSLASGADKEAASNTTVLQGQVGLLNALKETQREHSETLAKHGKRLDGLDKKVERLERKVDAGFTKADENFTQINANFAEVERQFTLVHKGIAGITELLTDESDEPKEKG